MKPTQQMVLQTTHQSIRETAQTAYTTGTHQCAEAVVYAVCQNLAPDMPPSVLAAATGFSAGVGGARCMCGALSAGVICLGYFFGRSFPTTTTDPHSLKTLALAHELQAHFKDNYKVLCCHVHTKEGHTKESQANCAAFVGEVAAKTAEIILREQGVRQ